MQHPLKKSLAVEETIPFHKQQHRVVYKIFLVTNLFLLLRNGPQKIYRHFLKMKATSPYLQICAVMLIISLNILEVQSLSIKLTLNRH